MSQNTTPCQHALHVPSLVSYYTITTTTTITTTIIAITTIAITIVVFKRKAKAQCSLSSTYCSFSRQNNHHSHCCGRTSERHTHSGRCHT